MASEKTLRVLIVEDNPSVRRLIRMAIIDSVAEIIEREDGSEALDAFEEYRPDVVLMDVRMPTIDGLTATRLLLKQHPLAKIVIVTDYSDETLREAAYDAGASGYVLKNDLTVLETVIGNV
jgi:NarL family two-component system response regulator LiaR